MSWWKGPGDGTEEKDKGSIRPDMQIEPDEKLRARIMEQYRDPKDVPRRIHIFGMGAIGKFIAHSLRGIPNAPPVTLIWHRKALYYDWMHSAQEITITTKGRAVPQRGFDAEFAIPKHRFHKQEVEVGRPHPLSAREQLETDPEIDQDTFLADEESQYDSTKDSEEAEVEFNDPIDTLILCVKAPNTVSAVAALRHRLKPSSTILFVQNGLGAVEEVNRYVFPDFNLRPSYLQGVISHGIHAADSGFSCTHAGVGTLSLGPDFASAVTEFERPAFITSQNPPPSPFTSPPLALAPTSRYLLRSLLRTPVLVAAAFTPSSLLLLQLEKLAINSVINPLTALMDCRNGSLLYSHSISRLTRLLLSETSMVIRSLPELANLPNVRSRFSPARLESLVVGIADKTSENISSMLSDIRAGRKTEIDYINGWVVRRGEELGVRCVTNYGMLCAVKGKANMVQLEKKAELPFVGTVGRPGYNENLRGWGKAVRE